MKLLSIEDNQGLFRDLAGKYRPIDKIAKEDLLQLVAWTLDEKKVELDPYDEKAIKNHAQQIVYRSVVQKLQDLRGRKDQFRDESRRAFLKEYEKYQEG